MAEKLASLIEARSRDTELLTWYRFIRVLRKITAELDEMMQALEVSRPQFDLLMQIAFEAGVNQQTCAERMNVTKGNIAQHIARLEKQGLIQHQKIGRTKYLALTELGRELVESIMPVHDMRVKEILTLLSDSELQQFQSILRSLDRGLS